MKQELCSLVIFMDTHEKRICLCMGARQENQEIKRRTGKFIVYQNSWQKTSPFFRIKTANLLTRKKKILLRDFSYLKSLEYWTLTHLKALISDQNYLGSRANYLHLNLKTVNIVNKFKKYWNLMEFLQTNRGQILQ